MHTLSLIEFSLAGYSNTTVYANSSVIDINLVGEGYPGLSQITDGGALECHTDNTTCCRREDNPDGLGRGEWYYPNGTTVVPPPGGGTKFYRTRGHMVIRLNRVNGEGVSQTGVYRCEVPGARGVIITRYITLSNTGGMLQWYRLHFLYSLVIVQSDVMTCLKSLMEQSLTLHLVRYQPLFLLVSDSQEP